MNNLDMVFEGAKKASFVLSTAKTKQKNDILMQVAKAIKEDMEKILSANENDIKNARENGMSEAMIDRLSLSESKIDAIVNAIGKVIDLDDPVGKETVSTRPNGLVIKKVSVPLGVVGIIYESRPNVTVDAACLCLKSGNVCVLRGGKEAINSNLAFCSSIQRALEECGFPKECVNVISDTSRDSAKALMTANGKIDVLIPRGGKGLIQSVVENATVPVIETGAGNCHVYVDEYANLEMANEIAFNARAQRPSVCNSAENLLVHEKVAEKFLPMMQKKMNEKNVELRGCEKTLKILPDINAATEEDFYTEYNDYILSVKVVKDVFEAVEHINEHSTKHSEAIITENEENAEYFTAKIDSAAVYVNASTRFTDGEEFGLGAEIGISTQKMHARGPMGLEALTTTKYVVQGCGQVRQ